jgi:hypothetical protein
MRINDRFFGVELEVSAPYAVAEKSFRKFTKIITDRGDKFKIHKTYYKSDGETWDLKKDASTGAEICTPAIDLNNSRRVAIMLMLLDDLRKSCYVTANDGLHVHVNIADVSSRDRLDLIWSWIKFEKLFIKLFPRARRKTKYARLLVPHITTSACLNQHDEVDFSKVCGRLDMIAAVHYSVVSLTPIPSLEFRLMEGTLSDVDIMNWIELCLRFVDKSKAFYRKNKKENIHISQIKNPDLDELLDLCCIKPNSNLDKWIKYRKLKIELDEQLKPFKPIGASAI